MSLYYDTYQKEPCGSLHSVATGQRLSVVRDQGDRARFIYEDAEVSLAIDIDFFQTDRRVGPTAVLDWNSPTLSEARQIYGLWRRTTWFMLDALQAWSIDSNRPQRTVTALGGWFNGAWRTRGRFQSRWGDGGTHRERLAEPILPYTVYPLNASAPHWWYEPGTQDRVEGRIEVVEVDGRQRADVRTPVAEQLANVPRFVGSDGTIYFFHRVTPFGGPEYSPTIRHGVVTADYAWYIFGHGAIDGEPITLRADADILQPVLRQASSSFRLHPSLREAQYFAGAEAGALSFGTPYEASPKMRALERDVAMPFRIDVDRINEPPMSVGLPSTTLSSWPRLASEPDEYATSPATGRPGSQAYGWMTRLAAYVRR